jgi:hypothetical protein
MNAEFIGALLHIFGVLVAFIGEAVTELLWWMTAPHTESAIKTVRRIAASFL